MKTEKQMVVNLEYNQERTITNFGFGPITPVPLSEETHWLIKKTFKNTYQFKKYLTFIVWGSGILSCKDNIIF